MRIITIIVCVITFMTGMYIGIGLGASKPDPGYEYTEAAGGTYWTEMYDDGRVIIHTQQRFVTNDENGNVVIKGESNEI